LLGYPWRRHSCLPRPDSRGRVGAVATPAKSVETSLDTAGTSACATNNVGVGFSLPTPACDEDPHVAADRMEFPGILRHATELRSTTVPVAWSRSARLGNHQLVLAANGAGAQRAAAAVDAALQWFPAEAIVSTGFCGALARNSDSPMSSWAAQFRRDRELSRLCTLRARGCIIYGCGVFDRSRGADRRGEAPAALRRWQRGGNGSRGVAERAAARGVPFYCIRVVTDLAGEDMANDFNRALRPDGHFATMSILRVHCVIRWFVCRSCSGCATVVSGLRVCWEILLPTADSNGFVIPETMHAAVYRGASVVNVEEIPTPAIGPGEILIRVEACGICHTDLKKIEHNLLAPPRVYGHETAGVVAAVGSGVTKFAAGRSGCRFHHIPCRQCFYCQRKIYAQCPVYKKVGITAGFEPAGGGFAQYVRVMDWIVEAGVEKIPDGISFERATLVEPLNTCLKAVVQCDPQPEDFVVILGQGPIGLMFTMLTRRTGARVAATDTIDARLELASQCGAEFAWDPRKVDVAAEAGGLPAAVAPIW
jgi:NADPH:quinone reductase-like Zn-dependent oxidoreductase